MTTGCKIAHYTVDRYGQKGLCWQCGGILGKYKRKWCGQDCALLYARNHSWGYARDAAFQRDEGICQRCGSVQGQEVNHIEPRRGQGYGPGCHNHQSNLETLCHDCHVKVTKEQGRIRRLIRDGHQQLTFMETS